MLGEQQNHRWNNIRIRDPVVLNGGTKLFNVKLGHYHEGETTVKALVDQTREAFPTISL
jgi:hypothetical protein